VFRFDPETCEMVLSALHPGISMEEVRSKTGWPLKVASSLVETAAPSDAELAMIARFDPERFWTGASG
jgi:glutaconate CoA-transferase subunit B